MGMNKMISIDKTKCQSLWATNPGSIIIRFSSIFLYLLGPYIACQSSKRSSSNLSWGFHGYELTVSEILNLAWDSPNPENDHKGITNVQSILTILNPMSMSYTNPAGERKDHNLFRLAGFYTGEQVFYVKHFPPDLLQEKQGVKKAVNVTCALMRSHWIRCRITLVITHCAEYKILPNPHHS